MVVEFSNLVNPTEFSTAVAVLLIGIFTVTMYAGIRLRSLVVMFVWGITMFIFIMTVLTALQFVWFWVSVMVLSLSIIAAGIAFHV